MSQMRRTKTTDKPCAGSENLRLQQVGAPTAEQSQLALTRWDLGYAGYAMLRALEHVEPHEKENCYMKLLG